MAWFSPAPKPSIKEEFFSNCIQDVSDLMAANVPPREELLEAMRIKNLVKNDTLKKSLQMIKEFASKNIVPSEVVPEKIDTIIEISDKIDTIKDANFFEKFDLAKKISNLFSSKKTIKIACLGPTQVGKSASLKYVMNLSKEIVKEGNGIESETENINEHRYVHNEVEFIMVDFPGFFDSKNRSEQFYDGMINYFKNNGADSAKPVDIIIWFAKLGDVIDDNTQKLVNRMTNDLGTEFFKHTIIALTYANSITPPSQYWDNAIDKLKAIGQTKIPGLVEMYAWSDYCSVIKNAWRQKFCQYNENIDIVLIENNQHKNGRSETGIGRLKDHTPIVETFYTTLFKLIGSRKHAITFMFLAGTVSSDMIITEHQQALDDMLSNFIKEPPQQGSSWWPPCNIL